MYEFVLTFAFCGIKMRGDFHVLEMTPSVYASKHSWKDSTGIALSYFITAVVMAIKS